MKLIESLRALEIPLLDPVIDAVVANHDILIDTSYVYDLREHFSTIRIEWNLDKIQPSVDIQKNGGGARWHSCDVSDPHEDGSEYFGFHPTSILGWRSVLTRLMYLSEVAVANGSPGLVRRSPEEVQEACSHSRHVILESPLYTGIVTDYLPLRVCTGCGYAEEGWKFSRLTTDKTVPIVKDRNALLKDYARGCVHKAEVDKAC